MRRIWVTGYRDYELQVFKDDDPKAEVIKEVLKNSLTEKLNESTDKFWLLTGPQMGVERWAAEVGVKLKSKLLNL